MSIEAVIADNRNAIEADAAQAQAVFAADGLRRYLGVGATDIRVSPAAFATDEERLRTWRLVGELARELDGVQAEGRNSAAGVDEHGQAALVGERDQR